jgi:hypothetical protein
VKFDNKEGKYIRQDTDDALSDEDDFIGLCDAALSGHIKFRGPGVKPDVEMVLHYGDEIIKPREDLGDLDESRWEIGLSGQAQDPWTKTMYLPLQHAVSKEMFTLDASTSTSRRAVGNLLRHYERMRRAKPNHLPVVKLKTGGFNHSDQRIGWVVTPVLVVHGSVPRDDASVPDTSTSGVLGGDAIPDFNDALPESMR